MTPRHADDEDDELTREGIRRMIRQYDQEIIMPRETMFSTDAQTKHLDNLSKFNELWKAFNELKQSVKDELKEIKDTVTELTSTVTGLVKTISQWQGSLKVLIWLVGIIGVPVLLMVAGLFADLIRWGAKNNWHY